ncbi:MAG: (Fe-S)-binding protein, partial [Candidatus Carbobacillus sp.]|nr:(Fe-S)-binding protein [Candidatus Carbobacillus sp.]
TYGYRPPKAALETRVVYHDACHLAHAQGVREQPRRLLRSIPGLELQEMPESDHCCGSAGIYNLTHPDMADRLLERKINHIPEPVDAVAMGNPGCMLQIAQGMVRSEKHGRVVHTVSLLAEAYRKEKRQEETG